MCVHSADVHSNREVLLEVLLPLLYKGELTADSRFLLSFLHDFFYNITPMTIMTMLQLLSNSKMRNVGETRLCQDIAKRKQ